MRKTLTSFTILIIFALGCSQHSSVGSQGKKPESRTTPAEAAPAVPADARIPEGMKELRDKLLTSSPEEVGLSGEDAKAKVWGVMMEMAFPNGVATLISIRDGTASLYTSTGGGIFGGYSVRNEAKRFVAEAEKHLVSMKPTKSFPYPEPPRMKFYILTRDGVYTAEANEKELVSGQHSLSPLFLAANEVLTGLRTHAEGQSQTPKP